MGSWANSLHVRHKDAEVVKNAIRMLMIGQGYREKAVDKPKLVSAGGMSKWLGFGDAADDRDDAPEANERSICFFQSRHGWVGVLDSGNVWQSAELLSAHLHTDTITVMVDDSDAWCYQTHREGLPFDEFNSSGDTGEDSAALRAAIESGDDEAVMRQIMKNAPQGPIHMPDGNAIFGPELGMLSQRVDTGKASFWDRCRYWWHLGKFLFRLVTGRWHAHPIDMGFDIPCSTKLDAEALSRLVERLRAVFPHTDEKALRDLLPLNRFPAEELLRKFLEIVDLPSFYAYLNYDYLEEHSVEELAGEGIIWAGEMRFDR